MTKKELVKDIAKAYFPMQYGNYTNTMWNWTAEMMKHTKGELLALHFTAMNYVYETPNHNM